VDRNVNVQGAVRVQQVALLVGAWIETIDGSAEDLLAAVALLVGAWIETRMRLARYSAARVALLVGAWIETIH
tara:strand:- start:10 stop:228 length:219 start_codon:yes stop_codon:yes gene_type:complete